jgi:hypothetical protein
MKISTDSAALLAHQHISSKETGTNTVIHIKISTAAAGRLAQVQPAHENKYSSSRETGTSTASPMKISTAAAGRLAQVLAL